MSSVVTILKSAIYLKLNNIVEITAEDYKTLLNVHNNYKGQMLKFTTANEYIQDVYSTFEQKCIAMNTATALILLSNYTSAKPRFIVISFWPNYTHRWYEI